MPPTLEAEESGSRERAAGRLAARELKQQVSGSSAEALLVGKGRGRSVRSVLISSVLSVVQKRRRPTLGVQLDDKRKEMLKRHPLSVMLDLKCKGLDPLDL